MSSAAGVADHSVDRSRDEFFVGYAPAPPWLVFYVRLLMPLLFWAAIGAAAMVSSSQTDPGAGQWHNGEVRTFDGLISAAPYPLIRVPTARLDPPMETLLLVETGKHGANRAAAFDGQTVRVRGWLIERDGRRMVELEPEDGAIERLNDVDGAQLAPPAPKSLGAVTLRGEIVDAKCFLGVMKPGEGKTHKECATMCVSGGIPPMMVTRDAAGNRSYYLLTMPDGSAMDRRILPYIADPVEVRGVLDRVGDLRVLRLDPADVLRM